MLISIEMDNLKDETSINLDDIGPFETSVNSLKTDIPNVAFKIKELESVEETLFVLDVANNMPKNTEIYVFEDVNQSYYSFRFAGEGNNYKTKLFKKMCCDEHLARGMFAKIIHDIIKEENNNEIFYIKPESYKKFTIVDSNDTTIQKQINFYKLFEYIENREGMINS